MATLFSSADMVPARAPASGGLPTTLADLPEQAADLAQGSRSQATWRAYETDWRDFRDWCAGHELAVLPAAPVTAGLYLADRAKTLSIATLTRRLSAVAV